MRHKKKILIIEDEQGILNLLSAILTENGYSVVDAKYGKEGMQMSRSHNPDLILLDLWLPDVDGIQVLKSIRQRVNTPIIVVSSRQEESDKVEALDLGANDYITKPFGNSELLARIRNAIRLRDKLTEGQYMGGNIYESDVLRIDYDAYEVIINGRQVHLTPIEYRILAFLSRHAGKVLTHEQIINAVWGPSNCQSQVLRVNMANIRRKIEPDPADPRIILTELGVGYKLCDEPAQAAGQK